MTEPDLFDKLRAIALAAGRLDRGTQVQLIVLLERALERVEDPDPEEDPE